MEKVVNNYNFSAIEKLLAIMDEYHSPTDLAKLKNEINKFFYKVKCKDILYTNNTDKLFFGMRVYPNFDAHDVDDIMGDKNSKLFKDYYLELDSKLFDSMLGLDEKELTAILLHEIGHIVYDVDTIDEVRNQINLYFTASGDYYDVNHSTYSYKELLAYALKDCIMKTGSIFSKIGNTEIIADTFVVACGYGPYLESGMSKISKSATFLNKDVDNRFITLSWVLRLKTEFDIRRIPAIKTLNKAKQLTASKLEEKEITYALSKLNSINMTVNEAGPLDNIKDRFSDKFKIFKLNGIRAIRNDIYELEVKLRCAETEEDLLYVIRQCNSSVSILQDYITEDIPDSERKACLDALQSLYDIRQRAAKEKKVFSTTDSVIQVYYPA